eukprot:CAMPEP_0202352886 /NCGR_PEP_ID=MMETSP1126-20121109/8887_1 /ASSEMBLY_ACC=CAM_ASM_000457 /TAXON_ID=3047 /ORGANISM="Dunaliella tertiolecta, Strain CCMP1320" /LENGTH=151 /DNA_ID=CAMNT_0048945163 /DNA_START=921 /DNA_END=1375 /DNA_ORIENTATION=-
MLKRGRALVASRPGEGLRLAVAVAHVFVDAHALVEAVRAVQAQQQTLHQVFSWSVKLAFAAHVVLSLGGTHLAFCAAARVAAAAAAATGHVYQSVLAAAGGPVGGVAHEARKSLPVGLAISASRLSPLAPLGLLEPASSCPACLRPLTPPA